MQKTVWLGGGAVDNAVATQRGVAVAVCDCRGIMGGDWEEWLIGGVRLCYRHGRSLPMPMGGCWSLKNPKEVAEVEVDPHAELLKTH